MIVEKHKLKTYWYELRDHNGLVALFSEETFSKFKESVNNPKESVL